MGRFVLGQDSHCTWLVSASIAQKPLVRLVALAGQEEWRLPRAKKANRLGLAFLLLGWRQLKDGLQPAWQLGFTLYTRNLFPRIVFDAQDCRLDPQPVRDSSIFNSGLFSMRSHQVRKLLPR